MSVLEDTLAARVEDELKCQDTVIMMLQKINQELRLKIQLLYHDWNGLGPSRGVMKNTVISYAVKAL